MVVVSDTSVKRGNIISDTSTDLTTLGKALQRAREDASLDQKTAAGKVGISRVSLSRYENGKQRPPHDVVVKLRNLYGEAVGISARVSETGIGYDPRGTSEADTWSPNPALKNKIPPRAYEVALGYCRRLVASGADRDFVEDIERLMIDSRYAQANKRKGVEISEEEWILLIDATWEAVKVTASWKGIRV